MYVSDYMELLKKELRKHGVDVNILSNVNGQFEKFIASTDLSSVTIEFEEPKAIKDYKNLSVVDKCNDVIIYLNSILEAIKTSNGLNEDMFRELEISLNVVKNKIDLLDKELAKFKVMSDSNYRKVDCCANCKFKSTSSSSVNFICEKIGLPVSSLFVCDDFESEE